MDPMSLWFAAAALPAFAGILALAHRAGRRRRSTPQAQAARFERRCAKQLRRGGWAVREIGGSGDQGADLLARLGRVKLVIQVKHHRRPVGNRAVQEVIAARSYYGATHAAVVASAGFTRAAEALAARADVALLDLAQLRRLQPHRLSRDR